MTRRALYMAGIACSLTASVIAQAGEWKRTLERTLETSIYTRTSVAKADGNRITSEGTALVMKKAGIMGSPARHLGAVNTKVRDGAIIQPGGAAALFSSRDITQFNVGDIVYLTDVEVRDDVVVLEIVSRDIVPVLDRGTTVQMRYKGQVEFQFEKGYLQAAKEQDLKRVFDEIFGDQS